MSLPTILIVGSLNTDLVTTTPRVPAAGETIHADSFKTGPGGKGANQAVACARLSRTRTSNGVITAPSTYVKMVGCVGDDEFGKTLKDGLRQDGIDVDGVQVLENTSTGVAVILVERSGENRILITSGANGLCKPSGSYLSPAPALLVLQLEIPIDTVLELLKLCSEAPKRIPTLLNPAPATQLSDDVYGLITHLILNETEASILYDGRELDTDSDDQLFEDCKFFSKAFAEKGVSGSIVITLGGKGAYWHDVQGDTQGIVQGQKVNVVDTTAAGDTFVGAFAVKLVNGFSIETSVSYAVQASAKTVTKQGAQSAIPWRDEIS